MTGNRGQTTMRYVGIAVGFLAGALLLTAMVVSSYRATTLADVIGSGDLIGARLRLAL